MIINSIHSNRIKGVMYIAVCLLGIGQASSTDTPPADEGSKRGLLERGGRKIDKRLKSAAEAKNQAAQALKDKKDQASEAIEDKKTQIADAVEEKKTQAKALALKTKRGAGKTLSSIRKGAKSKLNDSCRAIVEQLRSQASEMETQCHKLESEEE